MAAGEDTSLNGLKGNYYGKELSLPVGDVSDLEYAWLKLQTSGVDGANINDMWYDLYIKAGVTSLREWLNIMGYNTTQVMDDLSSFYAEQLSVFLPLTHSLEPSLGNITANFSRASTATCKDYLGNIVTCAVDEPRFEGARRISEGVWSNEDESGNIISSSILKGYLSEEERTNKITYSEDFSDVVWPIAGSLATITTNQTIAPDGLTNADKMQRNSTSSGRCQVGHDYSIVLGQEYTQSIFVKIGANLQYFNIDFSDAYFSANDWATFDLINGVVHDTGSNTVGKAKIEEYNNGWYRLSATATATATTILATSIYNHNDGATNVYTGSTDEYSYIWGAQVEEGSFASSYIPTSTTSVTRNKDILYYTGDYDKIRSIIFDFNLLGIDNNHFPRFIFLSDGTTDNTISMTSRYSNNYPRVEIKVATVTQGIQNGVEDSLIFGSNQKFGYAFETDDTSAFLDGSKFGSDTSVNLPSAINRLSIGVDVGGNFQSNATMKNISLYTIKLNDNLMEDKTN